MPKRFYDTNALLELQAEAFKEPFVCSLKTIEEIENIKTSANKDQEIKYKARCLARLLDENVGKYEVVIPDDNTYRILNIKELDPTPDNIILACAFQYINDDVEFISLDVACKLTAIYRFGLNVGKINIKNKEEYKGFREIQMSDEEMCYFYEHLKI